MNYVVRSYESASVNPAMEPAGGAWHGPYERRWIAESVARKQRKLGRMAHVIPVDKEVT